MQVNLALLHHQEGKAEQLRVRLAFAMVMQNSLRKPAASIKRKTFQFQNSVIRRVTVRSTILPEA
jgi:hypothetical protein